jgi:hypothetical protein
VLEVKVVVMVVIDAVVVVRKLVGERRELSYLGS